MWYCIYKEITQVLESTTKERGKKMFKKLFKKETKKAERKDTRKVYAFVQYVGQNGRNGVEMSKCYIEELAKKGVIFEDYEIIAYL